MIPSAEYAISPGWHPILTELELSVANVLRRARLPDDLFARDHPTVSQAAYFALWRAVEAEANDPRLPIRIARMVRPENFDPPVFAAMCSPDLKTALRRLGAYKRLVAPMAIDVDETDEEFSFSMRWLDDRERPPPIFVLTDLAFFMQLARNATREEIKATRVVVFEPPDEADTFEAFFGVHVSAGNRVSMAFPKADAERPFLTANNAMWSYFEPELSRRLFELQASATAAERVRAALLELLPNGRVSVGDVASKLGVSKRTLQRRLEQESMRYQTILDETREALALHYLRSSKMTGAEIAFLLGFDDPNSFFRAFRSWTGETPERMRESLRV